MASVAKSFDAPIKLLFPTPYATRPFSMLGLGDIVIPGIFVALALRFDVSRGKGCQYLKSAFIGYFVGIGLTIVVMNWFKTAQMSSGPGGIGGMRRARLLRMLKETNASTAKVGNNISNTSSLPWPKMPFSEKSRIKDINEAASSTYSRMN